MKYILIIAAFLLLIVALVQVKEKKASNVKDDNAKYQDFIKSYTVKRATFLNDFYGNSTQEPRDEEYFKKLQAYNEAFSEELDSLNKAFVENNPDSYIALRLFRGKMNLESDLSGAESQYNKFSSEVKASDLGKDIGEEINWHKKTGIGQMALDFTQQDVNDKPVKLSDFRGKYVLLDFWASWCVPCRKENPNIVREYETYKDKNFTVLGVSLDDLEGKQAWLDAIAKDGLNWTQLSDLQGFKNAVAKMYNVTSVPSNWLIDPTGKIIARNLRGKALGEKLAEVLGDGE